MNDFTKEQFDNLQIISNKVLIEFDKAANDTVSFGESDLTIVTKYQPQDHVPISGKVVKVPLKLYYNKKDLSNTMPWKTTMEVKVGDYVYMEYLAVLLALGTRADIAQAYPDPKCFVYEGKLYAFIDYKDIYFIKRHIYGRDASSPKGTDQIIDTEVIPINGYILCHYVVDVTPSPLCPDHLKHKKSNRVAKVVYIGSRNTEYQNKKYSDPLGVVVGDHIIFSQFSNMRVEYKLHNTMEHPVVAIHGRWVNGKIQEYKEGMLT